MSVTSLTVAAYTARLSFSLLQLLCKDLAWFGFFACRFLIRRPLDSLCLALVPHF